MTKAAPNKGPKGKGAKGDRSPAMQQFFALALPLCLRTARALDVRASTAMPPLEEGDARPDVDGFFVAPGEIAIQPGEQEFLDAPFPVGIR